jgi:hypothetical protein
VHEEVAAHQKWTKRSLHIEGGRTSSELWKWTKRSSLHIGSARRGRRKWTNRSQVKRWTNESALALLGAVTLLATVAADVGLAGVAVVAEVTHLAAVLALNIVHVARLGTLLGHVAFVATVEAAIATTLLQRLLTVSLARAKERLFSSENSLSSV